MKNTAIGYGVCVFMGLIFLAAGIWVGVLGISGWGENDGMLVAFGAIFGFVGLIITGVFSMLLSRNYTDRQLIKSLKQSGLCLVADITHIDVNYNVQINNQPLFVIYCTAQLPDGRYCNFESSKLLYDPNNPPREDKVAVWLQENNPDLYYVDPETPLDAML